MAKRAYPRVYIKKHYLDLWGSDLLLFCNGLLAAITGSPLVPTPVITLILFGTRITALSDILTARVTDASEDLTSDQHGAETLLHDTIEAYDGQIFFLSNEATPGDIAAITSKIVSFGFQIKDTGGREDQTFEVIETGPGTATITHPLPEGKPKGAIYVLAYTITPLDAASWSAPAISIESKVTLADLESDKRGYFRRATILPQGRNPIIHLNDETIPWEVDIISALIP